MAQCRTLQVRLWRTTLKSRLSSSSYWRRFQIKSRGCIHINSILNITKMPALSPGYQHGVDWALIQCQIAPEAFPGPQPHSPAGWGTSPVGSPGHLNKPDQSAYHLVFHFLAYLQLTPLSHESLRRTVSQVSFYPYHLTNSKQCVNNLLNQWMSAGLQDV